VEGRVEFVFVLCLVYPNVASFYYIRVYLWLIYKTTYLIVHTLVILTPYILM